MSKSFKIKITVVSLGVCGYTIIDYFVLKHNFSINTILFPLICALPITLLVKFKSEDKK